MNSTERQHKAESSTDGALPLANRRVISTRPRAQAAEMTTLLEQAGATVMHFPMIEIVAPASWAPLDAALAQLRVYDWLIFTSANGVSFFLQRLAESEVDEWQTLSPPRLCAIGVATAAALRRSGRTADVVAVDSNAEGLLRTILDHLGGEDAIRGVRFLLPQARIAREDLPKELTRLGAIVDTVEAYQTIKPHVAATELIALLESRAVDVITFTSPSTVHNFIATIGEAAAADLLRNILLACIGPVTTSTAEKYGLTNILQPERYSAPALVEAIVQAYRKK